MPNLNGFRDWTAGDTPTGDEFDYYIGEQVVGLYDDQTDLDTQLPVPTADGMRAYDRATGRELVAMLDPLATPPYLAGDWTWLEFGRTKQWGTYTPALDVASGTTPTIGTAPAQIGRWTREGTLATVAIFLKFGSSSAAGSGIYEITLPTECPVSAEWYGAEELIVGNGIAVDSSTGTRYTVAVKTVGATTIRLEADALTTEVTDANLIAWGDGDVVLSATLTYETEEVY